MKVALINPPRFSVSPNPFHSGGFYPNLGLLYVASSLLKNDIEVNLIDALNLGFTDKEKLVIGNQKLFRYGLSFDKICEKIDEETDFIGISIPFSNSALIVKELAVKIESVFPGIPIVVGGVHASTLPRQALTEAVDYVIVGEGEEVFVKLVNGEPVSEIPGIVTRQNQKTINQGRAPFINHIDEIPFPAYHLLDINQILSHSSRGEKNKRSISIITSRGCPFECEFCSVHPVQGYKWRARSPENVIREIKLYCEKFQINHIEFEDDNLTYLPQRAESIFQGIIEMGNGLTWSAHNGVRIDKLNYNLLKLMKKSGCTKLNLAIESGSPETLKLMNKELSLEKVEEIVRYCAELKIPTTGFMIIGYPGETKKSFNESLAFYKRMLKIGLEEVAPFIINPYPGTALYEKCYNNNYLKSEAQSHIYTIDDNYIAISTSNITEEEVRNWYDLASNIKKPVRGRIKYGMKSVLGERLTNNLLDVYRNIRGYN